MAIYHHSIISIRSKTGEIPVEFSTGDFKNGLGKKLLETYLEMNRELLENPKVSKVEVIISYNK